MSFDHSSVQLLLQTNPKLFGNSILVLARPELEEGLERKEMPCRSEWGIPTDLHACFQFGVLEKKR